MSDEIKINLQAVHKRIESACAACGRNPKEVRLLMATKTVEPERILKAMSYGELLIGENKVQELTEKFKALSSIKHETHFIGHLQTNKIKDVIKYADCIESVDRLELAEKLSKRLQAENKSIDILIQVNTSEEESKFGCEPEKAITLTEKIAALPCLNIKGLMTIGLFSDDIDKVRCCFKLLQKIRKEIIAKDIPNVSMEVMSMGMTGDLEAAIEEGSTLIRVGTAIFGKRNYPDSYYWNENSGTSN
ncbi:YggS family pyridoxal phosphate-dependent enzyme [Treponema pedis]|uniref:Pyridoxal phosphate homeostasis protein n=2 Tax=Treponema pedis TaxID=409322 RepID=S6A7Y5_9SPIR|nr:YggS family pyridoxal phosphate-dependent enzyme [Treponema pedis]AGT42894.1 alanine racemase [Treponema pedis str. T A4]QOW61508.1 YggS family pyridoxal phosphate-dependent enzyme [Treponema pedis]QSI03753.1 YggS family pyridoxal phosphate-dependent enzyme [Treponema pedis]